MHVIISFAVFSVAANCGVQIIVFFISFSHLAELILEVVPSVEGIVTSGMYIELTCQLDTGEDAPSVLWRLIGVAIGLAAKFHALCADTSQHVEF